MFSLLKKMFSKKSQRAVQRRMGLKEVEEWLNEKERSLEDSLRHLLKEVQEELSRHAEELSQNIEKLRVAKLQNPNIPQRAYHFMQGNRDSYIKLASHFRRDVLHRSLEELKYDEVKEFIAAFKGNLGHFLTQSLRNYQLLQNFFAHEAHDIGKSVRKVEDAIKRLESALSEKGLDGLNEMKKELHAISQKIRRGKEMGEKIRRIEEALREANKRREGYEKQRSGILESQEYSDHQGKKEQLAAIEEEIQKARGQIAFRFSSLEKALKKFSKVSLENEKLIALYGGDPADALRQDDSLAIVPILQKLDGELDRGSLGLDQKRTQKAKEAIISITKVPLEEQRKKVVELENRAGELKEQIKSSPIHEKISDSNEKEGKAIMEISSIQRELEYERNQLLGNSWEDNKKVMETIFKKSFSEDVGIAVNEDGEGEK